MIFVSDFFFSVCDSNFHPILPWVIDMSCPPEAVQYEGAGGGVPVGWRDLTQSKVRSARGDEQLDMSMLDRLKKMN